MRQAFKRNGPCIQHLNIGYQINSEIGYTVMLFIVSDKIITAVAACNLIGVDLIFVIVARMQLHVQFIAIVSKPDLALGGDCLVELIDI